MTNKQIGTSREIRQWIGLGMKAIFGLFTAVAFYFTNSDFRNFVQSFRTKFKKN